MKYELPAPHDHHATRKEDTCSDAGMRERYGGGEQGTKQPAFDPITRSWIPAQISPPKRATERHQQDSPADVVLSNDAQPPRQELEYPTSEPSAFS